MKSLIVIPCRYHSTRLPKKHTIVFANGKTMPQMVFERCLKSQADDVIVATDHDDIYQSLHERGCQVMLTDSAHTSGTDRVAEVAMQFPEHDIVINVQGDEPLIDPVTINALLRAKQQYRDIPLYSAMTPFVSQEALLDSNNVKVVVSEDNRALYFSRAAIGTRGAKRARDTNDTSITEWCCYKHLGLYAFERDYLLTLPQLALTPLAHIESLEQLRVLEHGEAIGMIEVSEDAIGVDTLADLALLEARLQQEDT